MKKKSINRKFSNSSLRQSKNKMKGGADAGGNVITFTIEEFTAAAVAAEEEKTNKILTRETMIEILSNKGKNYEDITSVTIPDGIVIINPGCFATYKKLVKVTIPGSVQFISTGAFAHCVKLETIVMPKVLVIREYAFHLCEALETVEGLNVLNIETGAFEDCKKLSKVILPSARYFARRVFLGCDKLSKLNIKLERGPNLCKIDDLTVSGPKPDLTIDCGIITDVSILERFPTLKIYKRTAIVNHTFSVDDPDDKTNVGNVSQDCLVQVKYTWDNRKEDYDERKVVKSTINLPILLVALSGDEYPVKGFLDFDTKKKTSDFKTLAVAQHPEALADGNWKVVRLDKKDDEDDEDNEAANLLDTLNQSDVALNLVDDRSYLSIPWLVVWNDETEEPAGAVAEIAAAPPAARNKTGETDIAQLFSKPTDKFTIVQFESLKSGPKKEKFLQELAAAVAKVKTIKAIEAKAIEATYTMPPDFWNPIEWDSNWGDKPTNYYLDVAPDNELGGGGKTKKKMKGGKRFKKSKKK